MPYHQTKMVTINYSYWYYFVFFSDQTSGNKTAEKPTHHRTAHTYIVHIREITPSPRQQR